MNLYSTLPIKFPRGLFLVTVLLFGLISCNEDKVANITFTLVPLHNGDPIEAGEVVQLPDGRNFRVNSIRFYLQDMYLVRSNDGILITGLDLIAWPGVTSDINVNIPKADYSALEFSIGLDPVTNDSDPESFEPQNVLSAEQNMHLGDPGYVFLEIRGEVDTSAAGSSAPDAALTYRLGRNVLYTPVRIERFFNAESTILFYSLHFEISDLFSGSAGTVDIAADRVNTSESQQMPDAQIVVQNFAGALESRQ